MIESHLERLKGLRFEIGPIRPPNEGGSCSLLLRVTRNCPWGKCAFCYAIFYDRQPFQIRPVNEVKGDIETIRLIFEELNGLRDVLGGWNWVQSFLQSYLPYGDDYVALQNFHCILSVFDWVASGAKTVFLQDADSPLMRTSQLVEILRHLKAVFPFVERITSYARAKTLARKSEDELVQLREAGLSRLHVGLESGDDEVLKMINKGVTSSEHVMAAKKALKAGFEVSEYVMPGVGGRLRWRQHALNTARVLNEINPTSIRFRRFVPRKGTPLFDEWRKGLFQLLRPHELLLEIRTLVENLEVDSIVCFDHFINPSYKIGNRIVPLFKQDYEGYKFPEEKEEVLKLIEHGLRIDESLWVTTEELANLPYI